MLGPTQIFERILFTRNILFTSCAFFLRPTVAQVALFDQLEACFVAASRFGHSDCFHNKEPTTLHFGYRFRGVSQLQTSVSKLGISYLRAHVNLQRRQSFELQTIYP